MSLLPPSKRGCFKSSEITTQHPESDIEKEYGFKRKQPKRGMEKYPKVGKCMEPTDIGLVGSSVGAYSETINLAPLRTGVTGQ